jgi:steroid delta-isomerase-like uncharacterized protein
MSTEENLALNQRYWGARNRGDVQAMDELIAENYTDNTPGNVPGREGLKQRLRGLLDAFPDLHVTLDDVIACDDKVVVRTTWRGTHKGKVATAEPTGKEVSFTWMGILRIQDGQIQESWSNWDVLGLYEQIGLVSLPE